MAKLEKQSVSPPPGQIKHDDHSMGTLDASSYQGAGDPHPGQMWFNFPGSGNLPTNYNISTDTKTDIELGLKIHYRQGNDITPTSVDSDGTAHYVVPDGPQVIDPAHGVSSANASRAAWSFDFSVNTGLDGSTKTLDNFDFRIRIADDDGNVQAFDLQHVASGFTPWVNVTTGAGATLGSFGSGNEDGPDPQLSQDSVNMGFTFLQAAFGPDAMSAGEHYDILLQAFDHGKIVAQVHDVLVLA